MVRGYMTEKPISIPENLLRCPICSSSLKKTAGSLHCSSEKCGGSFPIIKGVPILINESSSLFAIEDFVHDEQTTFPSVTANREKIAKILPKTSSNLRANENFNKLERLIMDRQKKRKNNDLKPKILVIGGSILGEGMENIIKQSQLDIIEGDVSSGPHTQIVFDGHDIPFKDSFFQAVIVQAVLEHVLDPQRCVDEIYRVLDDEGLVYAETPFMQQVHMGRYDFTRFTHLGHRHLFRQFKEIESGATGGPGMALAWSYQYFLLSFFENKFLRDIVRGFARLTSFWWKYFDYYLINKPGALDAAFGYYFLGSKSKNSLNDRELIQQYRGIDL